MESRVTMSRGTVCRPLCGQKKKQKGQKFPFAGSASDFLHIKKTKAFLIGARMEAGAMSPTTSALDDWS